MYTQNKPFFIKPDLEFLFSISFDSATENFCDVFDVWFFAIQQKKMGEKPSIQFVTDSISQLIERKRTKKFFPSLYLVVYEKSQHIQQIMNKAYFLL